MQSTSVRKWHNFALYNDNQININCTINYSTQREIIRGLTLKRYRSETIEEMDNLYFNILIN